MGIRKAATSLSITIRVGKTTVGAIETFNVTNNRNVTKLRELNAAEAGKVVASLVGIEDITLQVNGFCLYSEKGKMKYLFNRMENNDDNSQSVSLAAQTTPFTIVEEMGVDGQYTHSIHYTGCFFTNYTRNSNITGDTKITESTSVSVEDIKRIS